MTNKKTLYSDYLQLNQILSAQFLLSAEAGKPAHEEMLFIIMHQVYELWFKQINHELDSILDIFEGREAPDMLTICQRLMRIKKIFELLVHQFEVIETMTPLQFLEFRGLLGTMSGFQSYQFRLTEAKLGLKRDERLLYNHCPFDSNLTSEQQKLINKAEKEKSLFLLLQEWLERNPYLSTGKFDFLVSYKNAYRKMQEEEGALVDNIKEPEGKKIKQSALLEIEKNFACLFDRQIYKELLEKGDRHLTHKSFLSALFIRLYSHHPFLNTPDQMLTEVYELNSLFTHWRFRHSLMVQKMIGWKQGTGGSSGVEYLRATIEKHNVFSDLYLVPMVFLPGRFIPKLPEGLLPSMDYFFKEG